MMNYKDYISGVFAHPCHAEYGPKTPGDQLKAFLHAISQEIEHGHGGASFNETRGILVVENSDGGDAIEVPLADLASHGFVPKLGQTAEEFVVTNFERWIPDAESGR